MTKKLNFKVAMHLAKGKPCSVSVFDLPYQTALELFLASSMVLASVDTTSNALRTFIFAYLLYPEAFEKVIQQISEVVGHDRLPNFADEENLFLVEATYREVLRWRYEFD
jgi:hypothetical protein